ncbi:hypothetical protein TIFTF001_041010 [Ficus carica]|uniref:Uncharacterized protein n=1 Tax=Ficus carica TaxID=3494 RepID=A0AA87Z7E3_FICCA|nr:hypothetical protein TIFTF001_041010 [Ficus carica]
MGLPSPLLPPSWLAKVIGGLVILAGMRSEGPSWEFLDQI